MVLIPRDNLQELLGESNDEDLLAFVMDHFLKNPGASGLKEHTRIFMDKALDRWRVDDEVSRNGDYRLSTYCVAAPRKIDEGSPILKAVLSMAWTLQDDALYRKAIQSYTRRGTVPDELLEKLVGFSKTTTFRSLLGSLGDWAPL